VWGNFKLDVSKSCKRVFVLSSCGIGGVVRRSSMLYAIESRAFSSISEEGAVALMTLIHEIGTTAYRSWRR